VVRRRVGATTSTVVGSSREPFPWNEADRMFTLLVKRAAELANAPAGSLEEEEFDVLSNAIEAYEAKRWPEGLRKKSSRDCG
jgi:hypothetical protein